MTSNMKVVAKKVLASMTITASVVSLSGFAMLAPTVAFAAVPADYGLREGDTISVDGLTTDPNFDPDIYIVNDWGYKRLFLNPIIFSFYGHLGGYAGVTRVSAAARDAFPTSGLFRNCETNDQRVWGLEITGEDTGVLHWVNTTGAQAVIDDPNFFKKVFCINNNEFNWYPKGADWTSVNQVPDYNRPGPGATPTPTPSTGGLNGGAGSLQSADYVGSLNNEEVGEGENNVSVVGLDLEADSGSDLRLLSVRVAFREDEDGAAHSNDLDDYADEVSLWFNGSKVATAAVADFNEDAGVWSRSISITSDAVIRMSQTEDLRVAVSALGVIDSVDLANDAWEVAIENVRYVDAQGAITTETTLDDISALAAEDNVSNRAFDFVDFATAADLELAMDEASDNPDARVVDVDDNSSTDNVVLLTGTLEATGGDIDVKEILISIDPNGTADASEQASEYRLEIDGIVVQSLTSSACDTAGDCDGAGSDVAEYTFDNVDVAINQDDSVKFRVLADINELDGVTFVAGDSLTASALSANVVAEDEHGDDLAAGDKTGSANGEEQAFYAEGIQVAFVSASESKVTGDATPDLGTFVIKFDVTAFDTDAFIHNDCEDIAVDGQGDGDEGVVYSFDNGASESACTLSNTDETANNNFEVNDGETHEFTLTVAAQGTDEFLTMVLESINWAATDSAFALDFYTFNLDEFDTDALYLSAL